MNTIFFKGLLKPAGKKSAGPGNAVVIRPPGDRNTCEGCEYLDDRLRTETPSPRYPTSLFFNNKIKN